jgi:hypothetical protein
MPLPLLHALCRLAFLSLDAPICRPPKLRCLQVLKLKTNTNRTFVAGTTASKDAKLTKLKAPQKGGFLSAFRGYTVPTWSRKDPSKPQNKVRSPGSKPRALSWYADLHACHLVVVITHPV